jgi:hypothetical protein
VRGASGGILRDDDHNVPHFVAAVGIPVSLDDVVQEVGAADDRAEPPEKPTRR